MILFLLLFFHYHCEAQKIAILSYGSLVNMRAHSVTHARLCSSNFSPTDIQFPISYSLMPKRDRISAIINAQTGSNKRCWIAISCFDSLENAVQNLAAREGSAFNQKEKKYSEQSIFYMRKKTSPESLLHSEHILPFAPGWVMKTENNRLQQIPDTSIKKILEWAAGNNVDAVLWVSCPMLSGSMDELEGALINNKKLLSNAQNYIKKLPDGPQTDFEKAVINGRVALEKYRRNVWQPKKD